MHFVSATALFLTLSYFALVLFTKQIEKEDPTPEKLARNTIYRACGVVMLVCIAAIALYNVRPEIRSLAPLKPVFWLESLALWAFGVSWFIKGNTLLIDS